MTVMHRELPALPPHLAERTRALNARAPRNDGDFVLYWMHHAVRDHENAALDFACTLAAALDRPVLVYQGLGGGHRYDNDRHHRFILDGAREVAAALAARGVRHVFHLPRDPRAPSPLQRLVARACVLVCEDFPAPPFPRWAERWAARCTAATVVVDASCIVPMNLAPRGFDRAYAFRDALIEAFEERVDAPWPDAPQAAGYAGDVGFAAVDWTHFDADAAIAACAIDHTVPPVTDTPGGSTAGYARWQAFRERALARYADERNDAAAPTAVSRLSAYLHHGHVAATRVAREARARGARGTTKFIDELFVWRELAHHWCRRHPDPERLAVLPRWAQDTLARHAGDRRAQAKPLASLDAAASGDPLWDLAQASLVRHGELHNNLRMTWGKALAAWAPTPADALAWLVDLNHRYALDGSDPNSYGGLLWCLGLFDRPFPPERPVLGSVRPRPTAAHAARLDPDRYGDWVRRGTPRAEVVVIGAGMAGTAAATALARQGVAVHVIDKGRSAGGRMATRRREDGAWDHGAQYFTARDPRFVRRVGHWADQDLVAPWQARHARLRDGSLQPDAASDTRWVAVTAMHALCAQLLDGLSLTTGRAVAALERDGARWRLVDADGATIRHADVVLVTAPAAQASTLLAPAPELAQAAARARHAPCWAAMLRLTHAHDAGWDTLVADDPVVGWVANQASKPGRGNAPCWVVHAQPEWSEAHLDDDADAVARALAARWVALTGADAAFVATSSAHRWRYARVTATTGDAAHWDPELGLGLAGDACGGARIEDAWLSGEALAGRVLASLLRTH
jgi:photolyase PhrII